MAKTAKEKAPKVKKEKKAGVGALAVTLLLEGKTNEQTLAAVKKAFPKSSVSASSIAWYRNNLRANGKKVPTARELKAKAKV